jgi:putative colanic acid biosynthesis glycosyltransferase
MLVSIITVTRNDFEGLKKTIDSLNEIKDSYHSSFEHIIVDGLSSDNSIYYLKNYIKSPFLKTTLISENDNGIYDAMNKGVSICNGDYCFFLNSGDIIDNNVDFNSLLNELEFSFSDIKLAGLSLNVKISNGQSSYIVKSRKVKNWRLRMPTVHQGIIYKKSYLYKNKYDDTLRICSDFKSVVVALEQNIFFKPINSQFTILSFGGISSQKPFLLLRESLYIILNSSVKLFHKLTSCTFIIVNVTLFQIYFRVLSILKK